MKEITYTQAQNEAIDEEMARDPTVFIIGEDIGENWGLTGPFGGLFKKYGPRRMKETPISETAILGGAIGAAATGTRPIAAMFFVDFFGVTGDELLNQLQMRYMFGGTLSVPLVLRAPVGGYVQAAAQHSHSFESWFAFIPGLKVVMPATPADAKGLLKAAIRDNNPVICFEHKKLYDMVDEVPDSPDFIVPLGKADIWPSSRYQGG